MNRVLNAINTHGFHGEQVDDDILIYVDDQFRGKFKAAGKVYHYQPTTLSEFDLNSLNRIRGALEKANKARFRDVNAS